MTNFTLSPTFDAANASQKAELLLRRLGVRRNLVGFDYTVYMSVQVAANPSSLQLITVSTGKPPSSSIPPQSRWSALSAP